jgi:hypothetical protein
VRTNRRLIAAALTIPALIFALGMAAHAQAPSPQPGTNVNQNNTSDGSDAGSGSAGASNNTSGSAGSQSNGGGDAQAIDGNNSGGVIQDGNNESSAEQQGTARSGDAVAGSQVTGVVSSGGDVTINATNTSEDSEAESGEASVTNGGTVFSGNRVNGLDCPDAPAAPASISGEAGGCIIQDGSNAADITQSANSETGDAVAGGQVLGVVASDGTTDVNANNDSEDASSTSGDSLESSNSVRANVGNEVNGPNVNGDAVAGGGDVAVAALGGPIAVGARPLSSGLSGPGAQSIRGQINGGVVQDGRNELDVEQLADSTTGDAVAGGQIMGIVASGGTTSVTADNTSEDADATSGESGAVNDAIGNAGIEVEDLGGGGGAASIDATTIDAAVVQDGRNTTEIAQAARSATGDAVAGGSIFGIVNTGGDVVVDAVNSSEDDEAESGASGSSNGAFGLAGAEVFTEPLVGDASIEGDEILANVVQDGNNETSIDQTSDSGSGDAVAGGQILGLVGAGDASIRLDNTSEDSQATSGESAVANFGSGVAKADVTIETELLASIDSTSLAANVVHEGDNETSIAQEASGSTGDAVAGGQVVGGVTAAGGSLAVDATNNSEDAEAESGQSSVAQSAVGASENFLDLQEVVDDDSIEAFVLGAGIVQEGDNATEVSQVAGSATGDAVAGGQIVGAVTAGDTSLVLDNNSEDAQSESGATDVVQTAVGTAGNVVQAVEEVDLDSIEFGFGVAGIVQEGENETSLEQETAASTGDAVAGGQVVGAVTAAGGSTSVDATNTSEDDQATSGESAVNNELFGRALNAVSPILAGPQGAGAASIEGLFVFGNIIHEGDNAVDGAQSTVAASGDAVAGGQIVGLVGAGDTSAVLDNTSEDGEATSGDVAADQTGSLTGENLVGGDGLFGPASIEVLFGGADIIHEGDNESSLEQALNAASGDAVAGGQIAGAVTGAGGSTSIDATNLSEDSQSTSGDSTASQFGESRATNRSDTCCLAASIEGDFVFADIIHEGDNTADLAQDASTASGDAVSGGQIFGVVGSGGNVDIVADSTSEDAQSESGAASADNIGSVLASNAFNSQFLLDGPDAASIELGFGEAGIIHEGDNEAALEQGVSAATGDAVAGGEIVGVVAGDGSDIALDLTNTSEDDSAETGSADASNGGVAVAADLRGSSLELTPASIEAGVLDAGTVHDGDNELDAVQSAAASSGDAVGGGQVMGVVGSGGDASIVASNASEDADATSGDSEAANLAVALAANVDGSFFGGPGGGSIEAGTSIAANIVQSGGNDLDLTQALDSGTGDAVAGGQIAGVVAPEGGNVSIDVTNTSEDAESESGASTGSSEALAVSGNLQDALIQAASIEGEIDADIVHDGSNRLSVDQGLSIGSGDALSGAQVLGVVAAGNVDIVQDSTSEDDSSVTGETSGESSTTNINGSQVDSAFVVNGASIFQLAGLLGGGVLFFG